MCERQGKIEERLDRWLGNFSSTEEKRLAITLFLNIDYFSQEKVEDILKRYKIKISQYLANQNRTWNDVLLIIPDNNADSTQYHSYTVRKLWEIPQEAVVSKSNFEKDGISGKFLLFFNDTHGSGRQFLNEFSTLISSVGIENCLIVCFSITSFAFKEFRSNLSGVNVIPEIPTPTIFEKNIFTPKQLDLLKGLGKKVYAKHPMGFGNCGLLVAYHFQCPNNNLPIVWANGINNSYFDIESGTVVNGFPWTPLFEYTQKIKSSPKKKTNRSLSELIEAFNLARIDRIGKNRRKTLRQILAELESLEPRVFRGQILFIRIWKQKYKDATNRKEFFTALDKTQNGIDALLSLSTSEEERNYSFDLLAEFAVDFSQSAGLYADINTVVSHLNKAIEHIGNLIGVGEISERDISSKSHLLCLRAKCRRALASVFKRRGFRNNETRKKIDALRRNALNDAEKAYTLIHSHTSELEYALCLLARTDTTTSEYARLGFSLLESARKEGSNLLALYELVKQMRMRYQHRAAAELFYEIAHKDADIIRVYENTTHLAAAVIGMYYDRDAYTQYALLASELLDELIATDRYNAKHIVDLCYIKAILGISISESIKPLRMFKADSDSAWNDLATLAYEASKNVDTLSEALLVGLEEPVIWSRIGSFYSEFVKDYHKAIEFYDRALTIKRSSPTIHLSKAQIYAYKLNDYKNAKISLSFVYSLKHHMWGWYKSIEREGVFSELEEFLASKNKAIKTDL